MKPLSDILNYTHPHVIRRFAKDHPSEAHRAEEIFTDLMRFFWAGRMHEQDKKNNPADANLRFSFIMDEEMKNIDQMWHVFLLYTKDYMAFCDDYFGEYLHHLPDLVDKMESQNDSFSQNLERFLSYTYDRLGADVLKRWYAVSI